MEAEAFLLGIWNNFEEMEEAITMEELQLILEATRKKDMTHWKFQASLKGIDLDTEEKTGMTVEDKIEEMKAREAGIPKDTWDFQNIGIVVESE